VLELSAEIVRPSSEWAQDDTSAGAPLQFIVVAKPRRSGAAPLQNPIVL